ncbi:Arginine--tRNA ligase, cytoplasmic [Cyphellophora attinorum]|uniref:Arginine--tRNA ligase, cytoplasmic n=1 Tax=Cyphellophora attinorum TaxID=1664694 RepID=A0A0N1H3A1_9EURO|nr:Arginine--tRNA ligase, cytoplasmic [Phialophora attinorum]KPI39297.1 Arginine--tRNA ligase, cytoplasmic [Phialophora attinorum]
MSSITTAGFQTLLRTVGVEHLVAVGSKLDGLSDLLDAYRSHLVDFIVRETKISVDWALGWLRWPSEVGDLTVVVSRPRLQDLDPIAGAIELAKTPFPDGINLRFILSEAALWRLVIPFILDRAHGYGVPVQGSADSQTANVKRRVLIEFSSPNLARGFDGNHLRSTIVGNFLAASYATTGWDDGRDLGWPEKLERKPLEYLLDLSTKVELLRHDSGSAIHGNDSNDALDRRAMLDTEKDTFFKDLEDGNLNALKLWKRFHDAGIAAYKRLYRHMNVTFDIFSGESQVSVDSISEVEQCLTAAGKYELSAGAWVVDFKQHGHAGLGIGILRYKNGTTSYLLRDVAAVLHRAKAFLFDKMLYVVAAKQDSHFRQVLVCLQMMGLAELAQKIEHVRFSPIKVASNGTQSAGNIVADLLEDAWLSAKHTDADRECQPGRSSPGTSTVSGDDWPDIASLAVQILSSKRASTVSLNADMPTDRSACDMLYGCLHLLTQAIEQHASCTVSSTGSNTSSPLEGGVS